MTLTSAPGRTAQVPIHACVCLVTGRHGLPHGQVRVTRYCIDEALTVTQQLHSLTRRLQRQCGRGGPVLYTAHPTQPPRRVASACTGAAPPRVHDTRCMQNALQVVGHKAHHTHAKPRLGSCVNGSATAQGRCAKLRSRVTCSYAACTRSRPQSSWTCPRCTPTVDQVRMASTAPPI